MTSRFFISSLVFVFVLVLIVMASEFNPFISWLILALLVTVLFFKLPPNAWRLIVVCGLGMAFVGFLLFNLILWINFREERMQIDHQYGVPKEIKIQTIFGKHIATLGFLFGSWLGFHASKVTPLGERE